MEVSSFMCLWPGNVLMNKRERTDIFKFYSPSKNEDWAWKITKLIS